MAEEKAESVMSAKIIKQRGDTKTTVTSKIFNKNEKTEGPSVKGSAKSQGKREVKGNGSDAYTVDSIKESNSVDVTLNKKTYEGSVAEVGIKTEEKLFGAIDSETSLNAKSMEGEVEISNQVNLFEDGKLTGKVDVGIDASGSVVDGEISYQLGSDTTNMHMKTEGELISGDVALGFGLGKDVSFKNSAGEEITGTGFAGEVGGEIYLAQGSATAGFSLFGIKFDTKITGKFGGIGAKASVGATNNGFSASLAAGAVLGLGVDLSLDFTDAFWKKDSWKKIFSPSEEIGVDKDSSTNAPGGGGGGFRGSASGNGGENIVLRVTPEELTKQADTIQNQINRMNKEWTNLTSLLSAMQNYWTGEAGDSHGKQFRGFKDEMDQILLRLKNHPDNLQKMAGVYRQAETDSANLSATLAGDIAE